LGLVEALDGGARFHPGIDEGQSISGPLLGRLCGERGYCRDAGRPRGSLGIAGVTIRTGIISAAAVWLGFVATTQTVNYSFGKRPLKLLFIDSGHWLVVLLLQGVVIGFMGVS